jgi:hypothetical protein
VTVELEMSVRVTAYFRSTRHPTQAWEFPSSYSRPRIERIVHAFAANHGLELAEVNSVQYVDLTALPKGE